MRHHVKTLPGYVRVEKALGFVKNKVWEQLKVCAGVGWWCWASGGNRRPHRVVSFCSVNRTKEREVQFVCGGELPVDIKPGGVEKDGREGMGKGGVVGVCEQLTNRKEDSSKACKCEETHTPFDGLVPVVANHFVYSSLDECGGVWKNGFGTLVIILDVTGTHNCGQRPAPTYVTAATRQFYHGRLKPHEIFFPNCKMGFIRKKIKYLLVRSSNS
ncbi:hypothetical protein HNY73_018086 [Argiope bruennichi]|uniref:Uncharacterized protein n=1 Tax=Argiope bruennichi TaxID=94029 RepID=A0A8T0ECW7_ARGBR|nr:hypothetical protein HNY73_018086 [Argiope bruennichi]